MKIVIYPTNNNNNIGVLFSTGVLSLEETALKDVPQGLPFAIIDADTIDGVFVDAYEYRDNKAVVNFSKAKEIWKNRWRAARKTLLEKLDVDYIRALETNNTQKLQQIAEKKQALRDVTNAYLPDDLQGIKFVWPAILNE